MLNSGIRNVLNNMAFEKQNELDSESIQKSNDEIGTSNEIMDNLNRYFSEHGIPDWFGDYYMENNEVYVLLVDLDLSNKKQVQIWAKSEDILFEKARFSYNYLISVFDNVSNAMKKNQITFISSICLDSKSNQIKLEINCEITSEEEEILYSYDKEWKGAVFNVNYNK